MDGPTYPANRAGPNGLMSGTYVLAWPVLHTRTRYAAFRYLLHKGRLTMTFFPSLRSIIGAMLLASSTLPAYAVTFTLGNNPQSDEQNVLYSAAQTGTSITGLTNQTNTS